MTPETLAFIRTLVNNLSLPVSDPNFRSNALSMIKLLDELDQEEAACR
jgi:hypothetical protein